MFIVIGMGPDPTLVCQRCGETVLELRPDGTPATAEGVTPYDPQLSIFDQIK